MSKNCDTFVSCTTSRAKTLIHSHVFGKWCRWCSGVPPPSQLPPGPEKIKGGGREGRRGEGRRGKERTGKEREGR